MALTPRRLFCVLLAALVLLCACGREGVPGGTAPSATSADGSPAAPASYDFRLKELPEIGAYENKTADPFYDAPLREFRTSDRYGALVPYRLSAADGEMGEFDRCGFMTLDGRIVTGAVYRRIIAEDCNGTTVFCAVCKVLDERPDAVPDRVTDEEGAAAAWQRKEDYYSDSVRYQLISADGANCLTLRDYPTVFTDPVSGVSLISCAEYRDYDVFTGVGLERFVLYNAKLEPVADLSDDVRDYDRAWIAACWKDGCAIQAERMAGEKGQYVCDVLFCQNGRLDHVLAMGTEYPLGVFRDFVVGDDQVYDGNGDALYQLENEYPYFVYDARRHCLFICYAEMRQLIRIDSGGSVSRVSFRLPSAEDVSFTGYDAGGEMYLVVSLGYNYEEGRGCLVFDGDLAQVCEIGMDGADKTAFCRGYDNHGPGVFLVARDGRTDVLDITGQKVADVPFPYEGFSANYGAVDSDIFYLYSSDRRFAVCSATDHSVRTGSLDQDAPPSPNYIGKDLLVYSEDVGGEDEYKFLNVIWDIASGKRLVDQITVFDAFFLNGKTWFSYVKNGKAYVCDEDLNVIAVLYDDLLV